MCNLDSDTTHMMWNCLKTYKRKSTYAQTMEIKEAGNSFQDFLNSFTMKDEY